MDEKTAQVMAFIESLPEKELRKLAATVELDRTANKLGLPHNAIMALLRPSLALIRAPRALIPQRAFCLPFEDMLINGKPDPRPDGAVDRSSIVPMWKWLTGDLAGNLMQVTCGKYTEAEHEGDDREIRSLSRELWSIGAEALTAGLAELDEDEAKLKAVTKKTRRQSGTCRYPPDGGDLADRGTAGETESQTATETHGGFQQGAAGACGRSLRGGGEYQPTRCGRPFAGHRRTAAAALPGHETDQVDHARGG